MASNSTESELYKCSSVQSLLLPLVNESTWPVALRAVLYLVALFWSFMGVSIVADVFMTSIERITSTTRTVSVHNAESGNTEEMEVKIWNDTVANLTLMALGSSAPEILLSIIEIVGNGFNAGDLGPGTIVGSAAFNLLVITAVCVAAVGDEGRRIKQFGVFCITAAFSVLAYAWLAFILVVTSPNQVTVWEGVTTFALFFVLVVAAYSMDSKLCCSASRHTNANAASRIEVNEAEVRQMLQDLSLNSGSGLTEEELQQLAVQRFSDRMPHSRGWYRINAIRQMAGGQKLQPQLSHKLQQKLQLQQKQQQEQQQQQNVKADGKGAPSIVEFTTSNIAVLERDQKATVTVYRSGNTAARAAVKVETADGTATKDEDYVGINRVVVFQPGETQQSIEVEIIDDSQWEPDETFFVKLSLIKQAEGKVQLGACCVVQIVIINDDEPGQFEFPNACQLFRESCSTAQLLVRRVNGADGEASVTWRAVEQTAKSGVDFKGEGGKLKFAHGEIQKMICIGIVDAKQTQKDIHFKVELLECSEGAKIGKSDTTIVTIISDDDYNSLVQRLAQAANVDLRAIRFGSQSYAKQIRQAMNVNGGDLDSAGCVDYVLHFITFFWKTLFGLIPPSHLLGGWLCFFVSLAMIGLLTAIIGDLASIFGCLVGLRDSVTAITFVALGTSLPDLFASKQAAQGDDCADNAVGNVTGSNSVNVFLGLGLPWMVAACYHAATNSTFKVEAGDLVFSVLLYSMCSVLALSLLVLRRKFAALGGCELGGKSAQKYAAAAGLLLLWLLYVTLSALKAYNVIEIGFLGKKQ